MKNIKKLLIGGFMLGIFLFVGIRLHSMKPTEFSLKSHRRGVQPVQQQEQLRYKSEIVWVKTADNILMEVPQWQIDQMKSIQPIEKNNKDNPADASIISSQQLLLIQKALQRASNLEEFRLFYGSLSDDQQKSLLADAFTLGMQGLASLLIAYIFPQEIQEKMGATVSMGTKILQPASIITPIIKYLILIDNIQKKILKGHKNIVECVAYSPDGKYIVSGSRDGDLILWNGKTGDQIKILKGHRNRVECIAYSPDGKYIVSGAYRELILWNSMGEQIKVLKGHRDAVSCVAYSPDGQYIVSGSHDNNLILWNGQTGDQIKILEGHKNWVMCLAYSPDGNYIVSGEAFGGKLILWDGKRGEQIKVLEGHGKRVNHIAYSPDGNYIVSAADDGLILWDISPIILKNRIPNLLFSLKNYEFGILPKDIVHLIGQNLIELSKVNISYKVLPKWGGYVAYSPDGNYIVSAGGRTLILWNGKTGAQIKILEGHRDAVSCVTYSPDGNYIVSGSGMTISGKKTRDRGELILWNGRTGDRIKILEVNSCIRDIAYSPNANYIVSGAIDGNLILWKWIHPQTLNLIATKLNIAQARFLYRLYLAKINNIPVVLDKKDIDYQVYLTLPDDLQSLVKIVFPFEESVIFIKKSIQEKINEYKTLFAKTGANVADKIKTIKILMKDLNKNSVDYKACEELLIELETEAAFED